MTNMPEDPFRGERDEEVLARAAGLSRQERAAAQALLRTSGNRSLQGD